jgi:hypothetical protein
MTSSAPAFRTHRDSDPADDTDFHAMLGDALHRAPWLAVSAFAHLCVLLLLWLLLPAEPPAVEQNRVAFAAEPDVPVPPQPPPPTPTVPEPDVFQDPILQDPVETVDPTPALSAFDTAPPGDDSAFDAQYNNAAVGIGGDAVYAGHGGPHGSRRGNHKGAPQPTIHRALLWLVRHQDEDGHWDCDGFMKHDRDGVACDGAGNAVHDVGVTGLALLAFLGDGSTLRQGEFQQPIRAGVQWLLRQQDDSGRFGAAAASDFVYDHAIAAYAMTEACGLSDYRVLRGPAERGLGYLAAHRNPYGAWRYQPRDGDSDTSVTGWCALALASGKSLGLTVDDSALRAALALFEQCTDGSGRTGYTRPGERSSRRLGDHGIRFPPERGEALTAVAQFCRYFLGERPAEHPRMQQATAVLAASPPVWDEKSGGIDHYYWYYGTYAMYQAGGPQWAAWSKRLDAAVVKTQRNDGNFQGSWDPIGVWGEDGGRVYSTAILALCLEAYYRYTRLVR